jgi:hypothetical protein
MTCNTSAVRIRATASSQGGADPRTVQAAIEEPSTARFAAATALAAPATRTSC